MERDKNGIIYILPLGLIIGIIPLIVHYKKVILGAVAASYWVRNFNTDFFSYYKMVFFLSFIFLGFIMFYIYIRKGNQVQKTIYYLPLSLYTLMIVISTVFSECRYTSLFGFPDRYEGMSVLLGYVLAVIFAINLIKTKKHLKFLFIILLISAVVIGLIGIYQFFGLDFFQSSIGKKVILSFSGYDQLINKLDFRFNDHNIIYSTFYNPNFVGSYFVMLFMLTLVMYLFAGNREEMLLYGAINLLMFANWVGSLSRAGFVGGIISIIIIGLLLRGIIKEKLQSVLILIICFLLIFAGMDYFSGGRLSGGLLSLGRESRMVIEGEIQQIEDIKTENGELYFDTNTAGLRIALTDEGKLGFKDSSGNLLSYYKDDEFIYINNQNYNKFKFRLLENDNNNNELLEVYYGKKQANFLVNTDLDYFWIIGMRGYVYPIKEVEGWGFKGRERLGSGRGYIWSRSLPLLQKTIFKGLGPDSFALYFPQHDAVGKFIYLGTAAKIVDKPHNLYLQIAINTGLISLLAVLALFGMYFFRSLKLFWTSNFSNWFARAGVAIFAAFTGYAVTGLFNDSVISVAPVFWTLMGMGIMIEMKLKNENGYVFRNSIYTGKLQEKVVVKQYT